MNHKQINPDEIKASVMGVCTKLGFGDLFINGFDVQYYDKQGVKDCFDDDRNWVGQYERGSVEDEGGLLVYIALDHFDDIRDVYDTIYHEIGHALYELLEDDAKAQWEYKASKAKYGAEEAFADNFMYLCVDPSHMIYETLFKELTTVS